MDMRTFHDSKCITKTTNSITLLHTCYFTSHYNSTKVDFISSILK